MFPIVVVSIRDELKPRYRRIDLREKVQHVAESEIPLEPHEVELYRVDPVSALGLC